ncbi:MAG: hypothetical protein IIY06_05320, partial [Proteobacteria bacterium]|nr:hypothetical protein [Pseudomonadota bacterium]
AFTPGVAGGCSPKALRALYNALSTNFACIDKNIRTTGLAYFHIVMFSLRIQVQNTEAIKVFTYDCTYSYLSNIAGYGQYTAEYGCQNELQAPKSFAYWQRGQ